MSSAIVLNDKMEKASEQALPEALGEINSHNLYIYNKAYLANLRDASAQTKNRALVRGGGKKPFAQKGGGRARQGSIRSTQFRGGATTFGPTNDRNYTQKVNKKQKKLALLFAINDKAANGKLFLVDDLKIESGKTKDASAMVKKLGQRDTLFVVDNLDEKTYLAFRNIPNAYVIFHDELNAYLASTYRSLVMTKSVYENLVKEG